MKDNFENREFAGFWVRIGANVMDAFLFFIVTAPLLLMIYGREYLNAFAGNNTSIFLGIADFFISVVLPITATILFWFYKNATPGKMAIRAKILDAETGDPPSLGQCIGRYFATILSALPLGAGIIWIAIDKRKQGWHDKLAGTVVVKEISQPVKVQFPSKEKNHEPD